MDPGAWRRGAVDPVPVPSHAVHRRVALRRHRGQVRVLRQLLSRLRGRGLHSSNSRLNLSALYGIGDARRGCVARVKGVLRGV